MLNNFLIIPLAGIGLAILIGMIQPRLVIWWGVNATRGKVLFLYGGLFLVFFLWFRQNRINAARYIAENPFTVNELDWSKGQLQGLPIEFDQYKGLFELDLSNNAFQEFPPEVYRLKHLHHLDLSDNAITHLPPGIKTLHSLEILYLNNNPITKIPDWLAEMPDLYELPHPWYRD